MTANLRIGLTLALAAGLVWLLRPPARIAVGGGARDLVPPPSREIAALTSIEHGPAASDVLWLDVIQRLGAPELTDDIWPRLVRDALTAGRFDPLNYVIYLGTGVVLTHFAKDVERADDVLKEGTQYNPDNSKLWVQLGYNAYFVRGDSEDASEYWRRAATLPNAPHYLGALAALARYQSGDRKDAIRIAEELLPNAEPGLQRNYIEFTIKELKSELRLESYDRACLRYRRETGTWPRQPWTLRDEGYVDAPAEDLFGHPITLDIDESRSEERRCIARSEGVGPRQFERAEELVGSQRPEAHEDE
jgi:tetratricopeptide (TPR) repeat protein